MSTQLTVQKRAAVALNSDKARADLAALVASSKSIAAPTNQDGREECHAAAMKAAGARVSINKLAKAARDDANAFSRAVIAEEKELIAIVQPEEDRLRKLRDDYDAKRAREKAEKAEAERLRVLEITTRIALIKSSVAEAARFDVSADSASEILFDVQQIEIDSTFSEFFGEAKEAHASSVAEISKIIEAKRAAESAAAKAEADRKAAEQARAAEAAAAKELADKEAAERAESDRAEAARCKIEQDKADELRRVEAEKLAEERKALDARLEQFEADQAQARAVEESARQAREAKDREEQEAKDAAARAELEKANEKRLATEAKERQRIAAITDKRQKIIAIVEQVEGERELDVLLAAVQQTIKDFSPRGIAE